MGRNFVSCYLSQHSWLKEQGYLNVLNKLYGKYLTHKRMKIIWLTLEIQKLIIIIYYWNLSKNKNCTEWDFVHHSMLFPTYCLLVNQSACFTFRNLFRLPVEEKLDGHCECTLWSPHEKAHEWGTLYCSPNYLCFSSKVTSLYHWRHVKYYLSYSVYSV